MADQPQDSLKTPAPNTPQAVLPTPDADMAHPAGDEKFVPPWCSYSLEAGLWFLVLLGVTGHDLLTPELWYTLLPVALSIVAAAWLAHLWFLREAAFFVSWPVAVLGIAATAFLYFSPPGGVPWIGGSPMVPLAMLFTFAAVACLLTELQVARLLVFTAFLVMIAGLSAMMYNLPGSKGHVPGTPDIFHPAWFDQERTLAMLLVFAIIFILGFAAWALAAWMPTRQAFTSHSRVLSLSSPGFNLAIMGLAMGMILMVPLFRLEMVWVLPMAAIVAILLLLLATIRGLMSPLALVAVILFLLAVVAANLARPQGFWGDQSGDWLKANLASLGQGSEQRIWSPEAERFGELVLKQDGANLSLANGLFSLERPTPQWPSMLSVASNWGIFLLAAFGVSLLVQAVRGLWHQQASVNALAALALTGVLAIAFLVCFTTAFNHLGLAFMATILVAIAATRGEFDQEYQED
jgi:hypothetical protein